MSKKRLLWQLYPSYLAVTLLALVAIAVYSSNAFKKLFYEQTTSELAHSARLVSQIILGSHAWGEKTIDSICKQASLNSSKRITVILPDGVVVGDSEEDPGLMENHADRPEVKEALDGSIGIATRRSHTLGKNMTYVAIPLMKDGRIAAVVRTSMPTRSLSDVMSSLYAGIALEGVLLALLVAAMLLFISRKIVKPLEKIRLGARKFQEGDLSYRLRVHGSEEVKALATTMNQMAAELQERIERLKKMEDMRREFVANVSHELKTPITSIKGFAETLRDDAMEDPARTKQFLEIIASHAERISVIIEDLLHLSRIEQVHETRQIQLERSSIKEVIEAAMLLCENKAREKEITLNFSCSPDITALINPPLLEQAIINLIDNAIKYSGDGGGVFIEVSQDDEIVRIAVRDSGCGIPQEHLTRIFERFYRVDKGRSRKQGGTGLGLAIVKHIIAVHSGHVSVESTVGKGSAFTIRIPANPPS